MSRRDRKEHKVNIEQAALSPDDFSPTGVGNYILEMEDFHISYNPCPWGGISLFASDTGGAETVLCRDREYYILNGDFRSEYAELAPLGFTACFKFYKQHREMHDSSWSNHIE